ncbi:MAG: transposase [Calditrichota bacterium]
MIEERIRYKCRKCGSENIVKNGKNRCGSQQYICRDCNASGVLMPKSRYSEAQKNEILQAYYEKGNMRLVSRIYGVSRKTLSNWLKKEAAKENQEAA